VGGRKLSAVSLGGGLSTVNWVGGWAETVDYPSVDGHETTPVHSHEC
jgi:hypothetical protein